MTHQQYHDVAQSLLYFAIGLALGIVFIFSVELFYWMKERALKKMVEERDLWEDK